MSASAVVTQGLLFGASLVITGGIASGSVAPAPTGPLGPIITLGIGYTPSLMVTLGYGGGAEPEVPQGPANLTLARRNRGSASARPSQISASGRPRQK